MSINKTIFRTMNTAMAIFAMTFLVFGMNSCIVKPKTGILKGKVSLLNDSGDSLLDPVDFAGATVALYEPAVLDSTITRINREYPGIGVIISQATDFDHRYQEPVAGGSSAADGSFELKGIEPGTYNLAVFKEDWGITYRYGIQIGKGQSVEIMDLELYPAPSFGSAMVEPVIFRRDHSYVLPQDIVFVGPVTFEQGSRILVAPGQIVKFYGEVSCPLSDDMDQAWKMMSSDGIYSTEKRGINALGNISSIQFFGDEIKLNNGIFFQIDNSVLVTSSDCELSNLMLRRGGSGLSVSDSNMRVSNILASSKIKDNVFWGVKTQASFAVEMEVKKSVFKNFEMGVSMTGWGNFSVNNNYFHGNKRASQFRNMNGSVTHNAYELNNVDVHQYILYDPPTQIEYNNFFLSKSRTIYPLRVAKINNNNFYRTEGVFINIAVETLPNNSCVIADLDARNNYWAVPNLSDYLVDANDNTGNPDTDCPFYILYQPRRNSPVPNAGPQ